jgi:4-alpha-glucanotransferase
LGIDVWDDAGANATIRTWIDGIGEGFVPMAKKEVDGHLRFEAELTPDETGIVWYCFVIEGSGGHVYYYGAREGSVGGEGQLYDYMPPSFQITVYKDRAVKPEWWKNARVYQIFPDRYKRGEGWREQAEAALALHPEGPRRRLVEDWDEPVKYDRNPDGSIATWDFYGGTLSGIREELPNIARAGYNCLYLNPIFEAASNHRYDTGDYFKIDPMLGTEEDFVALCADAKALGMHVMLDGVFNHCGSDSKYFNKNGNYPEPGAWQGEGSEYEGWFELDENGEYNCWWGVKDLPDFDLSNEGYRQMVYGPDGVIEYWTERGASGWRLDVADELTDDFIAHIKTRELETREDAVLIGEVWEDASHKLAYGKVRHYLCGDELDSVMNYVFRDGVLNYVLGRSTAGEFAELMMSLKENYPHDALYEALNLVGSHDRARLFTVLGGAPDADTMGDDERRTFRLTEGQRGLAKGRFWIVTLLQMLSPGVPSVYYGDDAGVEGYADPYNRSTYPWGHEDADAKTIVQNAMELRREFDVFVDGDFEPVAFGDDVYGFWRTNDDCAMFVLVNASLKNAGHVDVDLDEAARKLGLAGAAELDVDDLVGGKKPEIDGANAHVMLWPMGGCVLYLRSKGVSLAREQERGAGVVAHITSVPNVDGPGTLGEPAKRFVDWLDEVGAGFWQVLPVNPTDSFGSPYAGPSAFAGNVALLGEDVDEEWEAFQARTDAAEKDELADFVEEQADWLEPYAAFMALKDLEGHDVPWAAWPEQYRGYDRALLADPALAERVAYHEFTQWRFAKAWNELLDYAHARGVRIIGDIPIYVSADSVDVWANPDTFEIGPDGKPCVISGAPPDRLAPEGQVWGNPTYKWDELAKDGYAWWMRRLERALALYDVVRLDHFLGFQRYFAIPADEGAAAGEWVPGPGRALFERAYEKFGPLPIIAEDLGTITPSVRGLVASCGFSGMDVLEFHDGDIRDGFVPVPGKVVYTSTHDTNTLRGYINESFGIWDADESMTLADTLIATALASDARLVMMPLQDCLSLDGAHRMNTPGTAEGNWKWQAWPEALADHVPAVKSLLLEAHRNK